MEDEALTDSELADLRVRGADAERLAALAEDARRSALYALEGYRSAMSTAIRAHGLPNDRLFRVDFEAGTLVDAGPSQPEPEPSVEAAAI